MSRADAVALLHSAVGAAYAEPDPVERLRVLLMLVALRAELGVVGFAFPWEAER